MTAKSSSPPIVNQLEPTCVESSCVDLSGPHVRCPCGSPDIRNVRPIKMWAGSMWHRLLNFIRHTACVNPDTSTTWNWDILLVCRYFCYCRSDARCLQSSTFGQRRCFFLQLQLYQNYTILKSQNNPKVSRANIVFNVKFPSSTLSSQNCESGNSAPAGLHLSLYSDRKHILFNFAPHFSFSLVFALHLKLFNLWSSFFSLLHPLGYW